MKGEQVPQPRNLVKLRTDNRHQPQLRAPPAARTHLPEPYRPLGAPPQVRPELGEHAHGRRHPRKQPRPRRPLGNPGRGNAPNGLVSRKPAAPLKRRAYFWAKGKAERGRVLTTCPYAPRPLAVRARACASPYCRGWLCRPQRRPSARRRVWPRHHPLPTFCPWCASQTVPVAVRRRTKPPPQGSRTALIATLGLAPLILVGHSLGGFIALTYAPAHADALRALIVVDMGFRLRQSRRLRLLSRLPAPIYQDEADLLRRFRLLPT